MQESPCSSTVNTRQIRSGYLDSPHYESTTSPCKPQSGGGRWLMRVDRHRDGSFVNYDRFDSAGSTRKG